MKPLTKEYCLAMKEHPEASDVPALADVVLGLFDLFAEHGPVSRAIRPENGAAVMRELRGELGLEFGDE